MDTPHPDDDRLLDALRDIANRADPVPDTLITAAKATLTWRTIDAELAELTADSLLEDRPLAEVRGFAAAGPRLVTFEAPAVTVEVEVTTVGRGRQLVGQLVPADAATLQIRHPSGTMDVVVDEHGRFLADAVPAGPVSLRVRYGGADERVVDTAWLTV